MADEVRQEVESQLRAKNMLAVGARLSCSHVWKGVKPHPALHDMVWDMVCLAAVHAMNVSRQAAWSRAVSFAGGVAGLHGFIAEFNRPIAPWRRRRY